MARAVATRQGDAIEKHLATIWESVADVVPEQYALVQGDVRRTWAEYDERSARLAGGLLAAGLGRDSKVALYLYNSPGYCEASFAAMKIRAIPVNVNYRYLDDELLYLLDNSDSEALVYHSSLGDRVARVRERAGKLKLLVEVDDGDAPVAAADRYEDVIAEHDPAPRVERSADDLSMIYTGGTTGMPKGVMAKIGPAVDTIMLSVPPLLQIDALSDPAEVAGVARRLADEGRQPVSLPACPLMHGTGLTIGVLPSMTFGGRIVMLETRGLDTDEVWATVEREGVQTLVIVGDAFARPLLRELREGPPRDLGSMQLVCSAGAMFSAEIKTGLLEHMPAAMIMDFIAATEGAMGISISTKDTPAPTGRFLPHPGVKVLTEDGRDVQPGSGEMGLVAIPGAIPEGYYKDDAKTAATFRVIDGVRYSIPGDWATVEADGMISLLGRGSQCINTGGEKVFPEEVEEVVKLHHGVDDCLVFGMADERFGQRVVAVASVVPGGEPNPDDVIAAARGRLSSYKVPREIVFVDMVPRAPNGKADYAAARELFEKADR